MSVHRKGVAYNADPDLCMVVGCKKRALYKNPSSHRQTKTRRGYCSVHRDYAKPQGSTFMDANNEYYAHLAEKGDKESK